MRILKPGDPCPCCGQPLKEGLPMETMLLLSWMAEGKTIMDTARAAADDITGPLIRKTSAGE